MIKNLNFEKRKNIGGLCINKHTYRQTDTKAKKEEALSGLSEFLPSAHDQGAVQQLQVEI